MIRKLLITLLFVFGSVGVNAADAWTPNYYKVTKLDSLTVGNKVLLTLDGYSNTACSNNRVAVTSEDEKIFQQLYSLVLSAFHSGARLKFYFPTDSSCDSNRIQMIQ